MYCAKSGDLLREYGVAGLTADLIAAGDDCSSLASPRLGTLGYGKIMVVVAGGEALPAVSLAMTSMVFSPDTP
jgi:hypothetical protein